MNSLGLIVIGVGLACGCASGGVIDAADGLTPTSIEVDANGQRIFWFDVMIGNAEFRDGLGSATNDVLYLSHDPFWNYIQIAKLRWFVDISTVGSSWISDASMEITTEGNAYTLTPGVGFNAPGSESFFGEVDLRDLGNEFIVMNGVYVEFFDSFDDAPGEVDAFLYGGSILSFGFLVPAPGGLGVLGCAGLVCVRRVRHA